MRRSKPEVQAAFNFLPDTVSRRQARDATLNVLDLFDGDEQDRSSVNFDSVWTGDRRDRTLEYDTNEDSLVDDYLEKNSLVDCSSATIPLLKQAKKKNRKKKKNTSRKERLERSKHS